jgi:uncharacterized Ntn-hydrolase superfamily protein
MRRAGWALLLSSLAGAGAAEPQPLRPLATYSIVARDAATGELGVAVQSHWFSVGVVVPWAEAGVGAVATQSFVDPSYGPAGLALMRAGRSAPDALRGLIEADAGRDVRQVAMIDALGRVAAYTGARCIAAAGHRGGEGYSVQGNLLARDEVWQTMAGAFESSSGALAERMLAALEAAERAGGDARGRQSAALLVVGPRSTGRPWEDRVLDLRVDDHPEPLAELRRLVRVAGAYRSLNEGDVCVEKQDWDCAVRAYGAAEELLPEQAEVPFWFAVALAAAGRVEESLPVFRRSFARDRRFMELVGRLPAAGLLPQDEALLRRIRAEAR